MSKKKQRASRSSGGGARRTDISPQAGGEAHDATTDLAAFDRVPLYFRETHVGDVRAVKIDVSPKHTLTQLDFQYVTRRCDLVTLVETLASFARMNKLLEIDAELLADENWRLRFPGGSERVTGPVAVTTHVSWRPNTDEPKFREAWQQRLARRLPIVPFNEIPWIDLYFKRTFVGRIWRPLVVEFPGSAEGVLTFAKPDSKHRRFLEALSDDEAEAGKRRSNRVEDWGDAWWGETNWWYHYPDGSRLAWFPPFIRYQPSWRSQVAEVAEDGEGRRRTPGLRRRESI